MRAPGQVRFHVTPALKRALRATNEQKAFRSYGPHGTVITCDGVSPRVLWVALGQRLIEDEPGTSSGSGDIIRCRLRLTQAGHAVLNDRRARA
ncbi:hypothetical protein [Bradyrhizobium ottawaense]|uniref:hypothetical protein n=1 Tax=Bradyrhizobium ottawaense TaxID=931866 RepID=UPI0030F3AE81